MKALVFTRNEIRYALSKVASQVSSTAAVNLGPLKLKEMPSLPLPKNEGWQQIYPRLSGICGSDLSTLAGKTSRYFEPLVSFPFVLGHEIVADTEGGERVVVDAVLGHRARGFTPPHFPSNITSNTTKAGVGTSAEDGAKGETESFNNSSYDYADPNDYGHLISGSLPPGIQTGNCEAVGGGWSNELLAHESQLHLVPNDFSDEAAVMVEPTASGIHAVLKARIQPEDLVVVIGAGTIGLTVVAALRKYTQAGEVLVAAKHPAQQKLAKELGATQAVSPDELIRLTRKILGCQMTGEYLASGANVVIDAVGSSTSIKSAMKLVKPRGRLIACGMPSSTMLDLAPLWHREVELMGAYAYGLETDLEEPRHTFDLAFDLVREAELERLVSESYKLSDYKEAMANAYAAGSRGDFKIVFDLRDVSR